MTHPSFESGWLDTSGNQNQKNVTVTHGLSVAPSMVKVLVKTLNGVNAGFIFEGLSLSSNQDTNANGGNVFYFYDPTYVYISLSRNESDGGVGYICIGNIMVCI